MNRPFEPPVFVTAAVAFSALGMSLEDAEKNILERTSVLRPLSEMRGYNGQYPHVFAGWLADRSVLKGRKYGCASNSVVCAAKKLLQLTGWTTQEIREAWLFAASSRGNISEIAAGNQERRPFSIYSASNTLHSEIAAAVSIECGIYAPWHMFSNGCSSGLDAISWAGYAVSAGLAPRAIVVAVDLPLNDLMLTTFDRTGVLSCSPSPDPYHQQSSGFTPAEAVVALAVEKKVSPVQLLGSWMCADAYDPIGVPPKESCGLYISLGAALEYVKKHYRPTQIAICPHASGTAAHAKVEPNVLEKLAYDTGIFPFKVILTKPWTGHSLGASGALDVALLWHFLKQETLPPNKYNCSRQSKYLDFPQEQISACSSIVLKISSAMGGLNTVLVMRFRRTT